MIEDQVVLQYVSDKARCHHLDNVSQSCGDSVSGNF